jgi:hypothetical protein
MPRAPKKCGRPGCDQRVVGRPYCDTHAAEGQTRANTTMRGYGWAHQKARDHAVAHMPDGHPCCRCGEPMYAHQRLDLDHTDDRTAYLGLAHSRCNARAGAVRARVRGAPPTPS